MVEPTGNDQATSKVEFIVATPKEIPKILAQAQKRRESISLAIGSESFITEITQRALHHFQALFPPTTLQPPL